MNKQAQGPLVHIVKRGALPWYGSWGIRGGAILIALIVCGVITSVVTGENPLQVYVAIFKGSFGSSRKVWVLLQNIAMLLCVSIAVTPAFKMRFWNIGGEGQALAGALAAAACMICLRDVMPNWAVIVCMVVSSVAAGALWGFIPAFFKAKWNTNETLFTLMMNYVAIQLTSYCVALWENPAGSNSVGVINQHTKWGWFPWLFGKEYSLNVLLVLVLTVGMYIYLKYSKHGYEISVVGDSENTARYAGISVKRVTIRTMALSGAICGLAGYIAVAGVGHTISTTTAGGRGFTAIIVAWLAQFNTFVMILISFLLVFLQKGAMQIASQFNLNDYASNIITGIILFFILGSEFFINYRLIRRSGKGEDA